MDYDMFLITRIYEYRWRGLSTKAAVVRGLARTGSVITTAGVIMMIAFSALLLSNRRSRLSSSAPLNAHCRLRLTPYPSTVHHMSRCAELILNEFGFSLVFASFFDTVR